MLSNKFRHGTWFKKSNITVKDFLDYVLLNYSDFYIKTKEKCESDILFSEPTKDYYLTDHRCSYKLSQEEQNYLSEHNDYFKKRLSGYSL